MAKRKSKSVKRSLASKRTTRKRSAEAEGGPTRREREFLEEHTAPLAPKRRPSRGAAKKLTTTTLPQEPVLPPSFRRTLIEEYRKRQAHKFNGKLARKLMDVEPPEFPLPPPANNWIPIGPSVVRQGQGGVKPPTSGRTPAIAVAPGGVRVYIGAANGGVWRSDDEGQTWRSLMDAFDLNPTTPASDSLSVGAIAIDNANPDRVYVGTGEGDGAAYMGVGPVVTNNGGANPPAWTTEQTAAGSPSLAGTAFYALAVDPADAERVVAGTRKGVYRREPNGTGAFHWAQKTMGAATFVTSVVATASGGTTTFYGARWGGPVYSSTDGHTWNVVGTSFPSTNVGRIGLAAQLMTPTAIYALIHNSSDGSVLGVWRLDIADNTWRQLSGHPTDLFGTAAIGFQGSYDLAIAVDPNNANRVYLGGSTRSSGGDWSGCVYRSDVTSSGSGAGLTYSMTNTFIGNSVHADIHTLAFAPGDSNKLWLGCDGGVFYSTTPTSTGDVFVSRNLGLQTLTMEHLAQHPTEDAVLFCGTQDNGCQRFTGEEAWLYSAGGDGGFQIINWNDPYKVLSTYVGGGIRRSTDGGQRYSYASVNVTMAAGEQVLFYAPIAGTPPNTGSSSAAADADLVAFGSIRPWISTTFGGGWQSIPNGTLVGDSLDGRIRSLTFASPTRLYAGTMNGGVYRFDLSAGTWTRTQIDSLGGASALPLNGPVTDIVVDPTNADRVYVTFGGVGDWRHVWFFDGTLWAQRSGPSAGHVNSLIDVQANALVIDPANPTHLYLGADIGAWRSTDAGLNWQTYSEGLPDAGVMDLVLHDAKRVVRASTHGRSVWERTLPDGARQGVELYVRSTQLDSGRFPAVNGLADPTDPGATVRFWRGPDIRVDTPDDTGQYQFPLTGTINFLEFVDALTDDFRNVATHATATLITRVYVQVHNRGVVPADNVRVMLMLANASAGLPPLPAGYDVNVRNGMPLTTPDWHTLGFQTLNDVRVGFPKIASFDLSSSNLPPPANLPGNQHQCLLAVLHHADDQFTNTETNVDAMSSADRKAAHKNLTVVQFTGSIPSPMPMILPLRMHNADRRERLLTSLRIQLGGYPGRVRVLMPPMKTYGEFNGSSGRLVPGRNTKDIIAWGKSQIQMIAHNQKSRTPYDKDWAAQRVEDVKLALDAGTIVEAKEGKQVTLGPWLMEPQSAHTFFVVFDRPPKGKPGQSFDLGFHQTDERRERVIGGMSTRVEIVPDLKKAVPLRKRSRTATGRS